MRRLLLASLMLVTPPLAAQAATMTWAIRGSVPDTVQAMAGLSEFEFILTFGTDGARLGTQMTIGPTMAAGVVAMDLTSARVQAVVNAAGDTLSIGIIVPPELGAQLGGTIGYRLDLPIPDSLALPTGGFDLDSLLDAVDEGEQPRVTNTGRTDTVAGVACEIWTMQPPLDSMPSDSTEITMCLTEPTAAMNAINDLTQSRLPNFGFDLEEMKAAGARFFGGRELVPVLVVVGTGDQHVTFRLMAISDAAPDPSFFTLPAELEPFPLAMFQGMLQQAMPQDDGDDTET